MKKNSYGKGIIGIALVTIGLMMFFAYTDVMAEEPRKEYSKELLINGGAEENADTQMIYGWVEPYEERGGSAYYGIIYSEIAPPCWNKSLRAHSGERFFCTNLNTESFGVFRALGREQENSDGPIYVYQDVDITEYAGAKLILSGYVGSDSYLSMNLLDKDEKIIARCGEKWREKEHVESGEWAYREHSVRVPEDAVTARVYLNASYEYTPVGIPNPVMHDRTYGYFDDISLMAEQSEREPEGNELLYNCGGETGLLDEWRYDYEMLITDYSADFLEDETERGEAFSYDDLWTACKESKNWCKDVMPHEGDYFICTDLNRGPRGLDELIETPGPISVWQDIDTADIPKGTELTLSGYVCKEGWLSLEIYDEDDNVIERAGEDYESFRTTSNDTWTQQEYTVTLPKEASSIRVFLNARYGTSRVQGGSLEQTAACFDDIHLTAEGWERPEKEKPQPASKQDDEKLEETPGQNAYKAEEKTEKYSGASMYLSSQWFLISMYEDSFSEKVLDRIQVEDIEDAIAGNWFVYAQMDYDNEENEVWDPETEDYYYPMNIGYMHANVAEDGPGYSMRLDYGEIFDGDTGKIDAYDTFETMPGKIDDDFLVFSGNVEVDIYGVYSLDDRVYALGALFYPSGESLMICMGREQNAEGDSRNEKEGSVEDIDSKEKDEVKPESKMKPSEQETDSKTEKTEPKTDVKTEPSGQKAETEKKEYTPDEIVELVRKLSGAPEAELDDVYEDGTLSIRCYETVKDEYGEHMTTWNWYEVDPDTMTATDFYGDEHSLTE